MLGQTFFSVGVFKGIKMGTLKASFFMQSNKTEKNLSNNTQNI